MSENRFKSTVKNKKDISQHNLSNIEHFYCVNFKQILNSQNNKDEDTISIF